MKGVGFANVSHYVTTVHGEPAWQRVTQAMSAADREALLGVVPVGWYDVMLFARLLRAIDATLGRGNLGLLRAIGAHEAEQDFNRVLRLFLRVLSPASIFKAEARLWRHFQDSGQWHSAPCKGGQDATLTGWVRDEALCEELAGYLARMVEFTGGSEVRVIHSECVCRGAPSCVYLFRWK